jgi:hypothetical protein
MMPAAEEIKASVIPAHAVDDKYLREILEDGPLRTILKCRSGG